MQKKSFTSYFLVFFILSLLIFGAAKTGFLSPLNAFLQSIFSPVQAVTYQTFAKITDFGANSQMQLLKSAESGFDAKIG